MVNYEIENLYIGVLGYVTMSNDQCLCIDRKGTPPIIFEKEKLECGDYCAVDFFTNQEYYFFKGNMNDDETIVKAINDYAIFDSVPMSFITDKKKISKRKLLKMYKRIVSSYDSKIEQKSVEIKENVEEPKNNKRLTRTKKN